MRGKRQRAVFVPTCIEPQLQGGTSTPEYGPNPLQNSIREMDYALSSQYQRDVVVVEENLHSGRGLKGNIRDCERQRETA